MKWVWIVLSLFLLPVAYSFAAGFEAPPPSEDQALYNWEQKVADKMNILNSTNRTPVGGKVLGRRNEILVAITSTNTWLYVNIGPGPGVGSNWKEVKLS